MTNRNKRLNVDALKSRMSGAYSHRISVSQTLLADQWSLLCKLDDAVEQATKHEVKQPKIE